MLIDKEYRFKYILTLVCFYIISILVNIVSSYTFINSNLIFSFMAIVWTISVSKRIVNKNIRGHMICIGTMMIILIFLRACRYQYFIYSEEIMKYLWYLYYIPMITIPFASLNASLKLGKRDTEKNHDLSDFLHIPLFALIIAILTNDIHHKAFIFKETDLGLNNYTYGPVYYIAAAWIVILLIASFVISVKKCSLTEYKKYIWIPLIPATLGIIYFISYPYSGKYLHLPEMFCTTIAATWEGAICIGLIPTNIGYRDYFRHSHLSAQIIDYDGKIIYKSENAEPLTTEQIENKYIDTDTLLKYTSVYGGELYWTEDLSQINLLNQELDETSQRLSEERDLIEAENKLKAEIIQTNEKNKIYDKINTEVEDKIKLIVQLVNEAENNPDKFVENLSKANLLTAYIKRKSNLMIHESQSEKLSANELIISISETIEYLKPCGTSGMCVGYSDFSLPGGVLVDIYDFTETVIEHALNNNSSILINISSDNYYFYERIIVENSGLIPLSPIKSVFINSVSEEENLYITLKYRTDGESL